MTGERNIYTNVSKERRMEGSSSLDWVCEGMERNSDWEIHAFCGKKKIFFIVG